MNIKKITAPDIKATFDDLEYTFRQFRLKDWGQLGKAYEESKDIKDYTMSELTSYALTPVGMQSVINISIKDDKKLLIGEYRPNNILPLVLEIIGAGDDSVNF